MKSGWQAKDLGELLSVLRNGINCKQDKSGLGDKISRIESISDATFNASKVGYSVLTDRDKERFRLRLGDILFSHINSPVHVGKTAVFDSKEDVYHGVNLLLMRPSSQLIPAYLEYYLKFLFHSGYWRSVCKQSVNQASVNQQDISRVRIPFPVVHGEQRRIVSLLDEAFAELATAKANTEKSIVNALEIFDGHLKAVFSEQVNGWEKMALGDLCVVDWGNTGLTKRAYVESGEYLAVSAAGCDGRIGHREHAKFTPVLSAIGAQCGRMFLPEEDFTAIKNTITLTPRSELCTGRFLYRLLTYVELPRRGSAQPFISKGDIERFRVAVPRSLDTQRAIEESLSSLELETQRLSQVYSRKLTALEELSNSLLDRAFSGEL